MTVRWKDKALIDALADDDTIPVTDTSATNADKHFTPAKIAAYLAGNVATTDNAIPRFDGTAGKLQNSGVTINDDNALSPLRIPDTGSDHYYQISVGEDASANRTLTLNLNNADRTLNLPNPAFEYIDQAEISEPASPAANISRAYARDVNGVIHRFAKDSGGRNRLLTNTSRNVLEYGAVGDGSTDDTAAFQAAAAAGGRILVPETSSFYLIDGTITLGNNTVFEGDGSKPRVEQTSTSTSILFSMDGADRAGVTGLTIDGNKATVAAGRIIDMGGATNCFVTHNDFIDLPDGGNACIYVDDGANGNLIGWNTCVDADATFIGFIGSTTFNNTAIYNEVTDCADGFGVFIAGFSYENLVAFNRTTSNGLELVGVARGSERNRIIGNHAEGTGDNGISVTGDRNLVVGNVCKYNDLVGIFAYGSFNTITGNVCIGNNQAASTTAGIAVQAVFGGAGQFNVIEGNICDDDQGSVTQNNSLRVLSKSYGEWTTATPYTVGTYVFYGLNIYRAATSATSGGTPPTHTSGTVSDGAVDWEYANSFITQADTAHNVVGPNVWGRSTSASVLFSNSLVAQTVPRQLAASAAQVSHTGDTNETTLATIAVPASAMGPNGLIRILAEGTCTSSGNACTPRIRLGGVSGTILYSSAYTTTSAWKVELIIQNRGSEGSQRASGFHNRTTDVITQILSPASAAIDTSAATTIVISGQLANSGETITLESYSAEVINR